MRKNIIPNFLSLLFVLTLLVGCNSEKKGDKKLADGKSLNLRVNTTIRTLSYNIHHCNPPGMKDTIDLDAIVSTIKAQQPDIVALQEVDVDTERSGQGNQAELIAKKLKMNYFFAKAIDFDGGGYGVAILSKFPLLETTVHDLPTKGKEEERILATAKIEISPDTHILFGNTHLNSSKSSENRILQMHEIVTIINKTKDIDIILAGDFNSVPESEPMKVADAYFTNTCEDCKPTFPANDPNKTIDYIVYKSNKRRISIENHEVINDSFSSDHRPILVEINLQD